MDKILCAIDFSKTSLNALEYAAEVASVCHSQLTLLHVFTEEEFNQLFEEDEDHVNASFKEKTVIVEKKLNSLKHEIEASGHKGITSIIIELKYGEVTKVVEEMVDDGYQMVVMGTKGYNHRQGFILGSTTLNVISKTGAMVMAIPSEATYEPFNYIVYATDLHENDKIGIMKIVPMATYFNSRINVVHFTSKDLKKDSKAFEDFKNELSSFVDYKKLSFDLQHFDENLNLTIEEYVSQKQGKLIALLDKKHNFFERLFHESLINKLTYITDIPLLVINS